MVRSQPEEEEAFDTLKVKIDRKQCPTTARESWISQETWQLADRQTVLLRKGRASATEVR